MELIKINQKNLLKTVKTAVKSIKQGKVIVCPTDTVYGLVCHAKNKKAVAKIFKMKKRSWQKPLSLFIKNFKTAKRVAKINKTQERFLKEVWPGQTIVVLQVNPLARLKARGIVSEEGKIGLRIPDYKLLNILLEKSDSFLVQTSANISGKPASGDIKEVLKQLAPPPLLRRASPLGGSGGKGPDLILDAGKLKFKKPSRVIDFTSKKPKIIRE